MLQLRRSSRGDARRQGGDSVGIRRWKECAVSSCNDGKRPTWARECQRTHFLLHSSLLLHFLPAHRSSITYSQLHSEVQRVANVLKSLGASKDTMCTLYLPMIPEAAIAMLACARIGVPHNVVFAGVSRTQTQTRDHIMPTDETTTVSCELS
jgi:hypothetical protein